MKFTFFYLLCFVIWWLYQLKNYSYLLSSVYWWLESLPYYTCQLVPLLAFQHCDSSVSTEWEARFTLDPGIVTLSPTWSHTFLPCIVASILPPVYLAQPSNQPGGAIQQLTTHVHPSWTASAILWACSRTAQPLSSLYNSAQHSPTAPCCGGEATRKVLLDIRSCWALPRFFGASDPLQHHSPRCGAVRRARSPGGLY